MKKFLAFALTALLLAALIPNAVFADALKIEKPEEMEYPTFNPLENSGEGFPTNSDPTKTEPESPEVEAAALKSAAESIGKNALTGVYSFVDASAGYNEQEGGASLWDGAVRTKWAGNEMPFINIAQLDGKYKFDGIIMATANDTASYDRNPMEWAVYGSNDGTTWDPICYGDDSFFELTNLTYYAGAFDATEKGYELVMFYSDIGGVSGFQISELVMCGERVGDSELDVNMDEANKWADLIEFTPGDPIANNGASYEDEAAALASIGGTSINGSITNFSVGDDKGKTPGFAGEEAEKLWDGDNTTKYCSTYVPETSIIEMDDTYGLNGIVMSTANDNSSNPGRNPSNWAILGSNDLENWAVLVNGNDSFFEDVDYTYYAASFDMTGGYKYFAFENMSTQSGTFQLAEVVLCGAKAEAAVVEAPALPGFETADEAVASIGKTAITGYTFVEGSNGNGGEGPENLWDGDTATKFCTGEFPISSVAQLDGWYKVDGIVMATANDNAEYNGRLPSAWTVSGSADGENWTVIASGDESFFDEVNFRYFAGDASSDAINYVKFESEGASSGCFQISELVLTGTKTDAPVVEKAAEEPAAEEPAVEDVVVTEAPAEDEKSANTFDFGVIAAVSAVISLAGFAASKKQH